MPHHLVCVEKFTLPYLTLFECFSCHGAMGCRRDHSAKPQKFLTHKSNDNPLRELETRVERRGVICQIAHGSLCEYMGHDVSNMRGFDSYRLLTLSLAALMTRISSAMIEGAHTSAGAATLARTVPFWGRFRSPREPTAGPCRGCLLPSATNTAPSRHHLQAVLCDGWDVQTPPSWLLRPQTRELYGWS